jgi:uncharacterized protein (DUF1501 family)
MLTLRPASSRTGTTHTRRAFLQAGGIGALGLTLDEGWRAKDSAAAASAAVDSRRRDLSCIFIFLGGGPPQHETWDPKPNAPMDISGPYGAIDTNVPGIKISELLPLVAQHMDKCAILRSMTTPDANHEIKFMLTGGNKYEAGYGAALTKLKGDCASGMPPFVHLGPGYSSGTGGLPAGGRLGAAYDPIQVADPSGKQVQLPAFELTADSSADRLRNRRELLAAVDRVRSGWQASDAIAKMDANSQRAFDLLSSPRVRAAFDLTQEKEGVRNRYGGSIFGQSCLLARRLVQAGTRFVQVNWFSAPDGLGWDVHGNMLPGLLQMETSLCPRFDQALSALLDDLHQRGLLASTLVVVLGEMGRTPKVNEYGGRDHWGGVLSVLLAGGRVPKGTVVGESDKHGAFPQKRPVSPPALAATLYRLLGIDTNTDVRIRPFIGDAAPVEELI